MEKIDNRFEEKGPFEALTYLFLYDDRKRWIGLLILIACGGLLGASDDANFAMGIGLPLIAVIMFGVYYLFLSKSARVTVEVAIGPSVGKNSQFRKLGIWSGLFGFGADLLSFNGSLPASRWVKRQALKTTAVVLVASAATFAVKLQRYETRTLDHEFASAYKVRDYSRLAFVTQRAQETNQRVYATLVTTSEPHFFAATERPKAWTEMLSSLENVTAPIPEQMQITMKKSAKFIGIAGGNKIVGGSIDISDLDGDAFVPMPNPSSKELPALINTFVKGGQQTLDGFEWTSVTFIGTRISYKGGVVNLNNVRFVNCTFVLPPDRRGAKLAQYVALALPTLSLEHAAS